MKKINFGQIKIKKILSVSVLSMVVFLVVGFLFLIIEIPSSSVDKSDWETYRNDEYGFEFKYPKNRKLEISENGNDICVPGFEVLINSKKNIGSTDACFEKIIIDKHIATNCIMDEMLNPELIYFKKDKMFFNISPCGSISKVDRDILSTFKFYK